VDAAAASGATLRWIDFDPKTGDLTPDDVQRVLTDRTRIVAATAASNLFGTTPDIPAIAELVHGVGAELYVDAVAYAAHEFIDLSVLGADYGRL
jgi:selenocysteine lyase/cysteine desulfurase